MALQASNEKDLMNIKPVYFIISCKEQENKLGEPNTTLAQKQIRMT